MCAVGLSTVRNDASRADSRVGDMRALLPWAGCRRSAWRDVTPLRAWPYPSPHMATTPDHDKPTIAPIVGPDDPRRFTDSGIEIQKEYTEDDVKDRLEERLGEPGEYPF